MNDAPPERTFRYLADLLERHSGQELSPTRYWRVETVLKPVMRAHALADLPALVWALSAGSNRVLERQTIEAMLNNETSFFRDQASFALLTGPALTALREARSATRRLRIWSAACSTGQEAYSLAMTLSDDRANWQGWTIEIVGSDISHSVVERAREGRYSQFEIQRGMPIALMLRYFARDGDDWVARDNLRSMVIFRQQNLLEPLRMASDFDIVLCRNMIMYLQQEHRPAVFDQLARSMRGDGLLMLGAAETVIGQTDRFRASRDYRGLYECATMRSERSAA
ncbi:CheR family methyltransferase [Novosphingopyxis sp.]|uniref:CheR family methyltransferase n=1 Tax=Novosphingopyxis sp. TaxID=2709690 RepID=UPI003B5B01EF